MCRWKNQCRECKSPFLRMSNLSSIPTPQWNHGELIPSTSVHCHPLTFSKVFVVLDSFRKHVILRLPLWHQPTNHGFERKSSVYRVFVMISIVGVAWDNVSLFHGRNHKLGFSCPPSLKKKRSIHLTIWVELHRLTTVFQKVSLLAGTHCSMRVYQPGARFVPGLLAWSIVVVGGASLILSPNFCGSSKYKKGLNCANSSFGSIVVSFFGSCIVKRKGKSSLLPNCSPPLLKWLFSKSVFQMPPTRTPILKIKKKFALRKQCFSFSLVFLHFIQPCLHLPLL